MTRAVANPTANVRRANPTLPPMPAAPPPPPPLSVPSARAPDGAMPRPDRPPAADPDPPRTAPVPIARHPVVIRTGSNGHHFHLRRRRCLGHDCHRRLGRRIGIGGDRLRRICARGG